MDVGAPALPLEGGERRPSYQYYNNQESTLLPEVPLLTGIDNLRLWEVAVLAHLRHYNLYDNSEARDPSTPRSARDGTLYLSWDHMQNRIKVYTIIRRSISDVMSFLEKECRSNPWISLNDPTYDAKGLYELVKEVYSRPPPLDPHQSQDDLMIDLLMLKAVNFGTLSDYLDSFYALWSRLDVSGLQLTNDVLLNFLISGLDGHYDEGWTEDLEKQRLMKKIDLHEALNLVGMRVCEENMVVLPPVPPKDDKYLERSSTESSSSSTIEQENNINTSMDESIRGCFGHENELEADIMRRQEEMAAHFRSRTLQWAVENAFLTSWSLEDLDPVSTEHDITAKNRRSDDGSRNASPTDKKERRRGYQPLSDLMARYIPLPLSITSRGSSPSTIAARMDALRIDDKSQVERNDFEPRDLPSPLASDQSAARKERRRRFLTRFTGTPTKSSPGPVRVMSYQEEWKPKPLFSSPRKFSWEDGVSNSEHDYEPTVLRNTPEPQVRGDLPDTPGTGGSEKQQNEQDEYRLEKRLSACSPEKVAQKAATAVRNFSRPERPLIRTASL
ncbi:hypothetical protein GE21DRAFT_9019 [Neurospora crassa]|uniref:Uncharacterized protein n=1 Tax=Neurospora crassa (strain ATCC 24698 / 74-OR23-1A / CBS 708.71 / DSM 1257 / FGSC 987) TaxID=367110 RepID=Q7S6S9_NEUCR|nr:hypothetical protein NCU05510 [Neurospora crassa OR74A]EAA31236.1 hypothetical protein NCU05510 [Neurospora crassa OR74A]KHE81656.1 hypothetical protein GE21DRAFT_9019 [Neurospora crassa]|eukprot:XP_960472.1 hypothetical protein NCU05510 [Neurospora crassa OR74A]